jgi:hypothetical protein
MEKQEEGFARRNLYAALRDVTRGSCIRGLHRSARRLAGAGATLRCDVAPMVTSRERGFSAR